MSLLEQQAVVARLMTDPELRERFLSKPTATGRELGLDKSEIDDLMSLAANGLGTFAESLVWKRLREVEKILPITKRVTGDEFRRYFFEFAHAFNPQTIRKHYEDAVAFCRLLKERELSRPVHDAAAFELTRLIFFNESHLLAYCVSRYDLSATPAVKRIRPRIAVWLRLGKRFFHFKI